MPEKTNREYRAMTMQAEGSENESKIVKGYASTFNQKYELFRDGEFIVSEIVDARAFDNCDMSDVIFQYDHCGRVFARKSNGTLRVQPDDIGLYIEADLGGTDAGRELYEEIKGGYTTKMSFGFIVSEDRWDDYPRADGTVETVRTILKISKLFDCSAVSLPANDNTSISIRSQLNGEIERLRAERLKADEIKRAKLALKIKIMQEDF